MKKRFNLDSFVIVEVRNDFRFVRRNGQLVETL